MLGNFKEVLRCGNEVDDMEGKPTGIVRVGLGAINRTKDISTFMDFIHIFVETITYPSQDLPTSKLQECSDHFFKLNGAQPSVFKYYV